MKIKDVDGARTLEIDAASVAGSVFLVGEHGYCIEMDRETLLLAIAVEVGYFDSVSAGADRFLQQTV